jgi:hypothetical protein
MRFNSHIIKTYLASTELLPACSGQQSEWAEIGNLVIDFTDNR